ncbi:MAG TPA: hypothetical protein VH637_05860 [Streptosporangiaceae bacterium]|jgi:hypothetical protein
MVDVRTCEHCGASFEPRREHARFCSARCRAAWNEANVSDGSAEVNALGWSVSAMRDTTERFPHVDGQDRARAFAAIGEAVWWVTIVDATLVRHVPDSYDEVLASQAAAERSLIEETLAGLRYVRNRMDCADQVDFIQPEAGQGTALIASWTWKALAEPALGALPPRGQAWEMTRYQAYQARLAGRTIGETFGRATAFLGQAAAKATLATGRRAARR